MKKTVTVTDTVRTLQDLRNLMYACANLTSTSAVTVDGNTVTVVGSEKDATESDYWGR